MANTEDVNDKLARGQLHRLVRTWRDRGEVRLNEDGSIDEIVIGAASHVHLEQMDDGHWWLGIMCDDGARLRVNLATLRGGKIRCIAESEDGIISAGFLRSPNETQDQLPRALCACHAAYAHDGRQLRRKSQACSRSAASPR
jgi:hypothetical protein